MTEQNKTSFKGTLKIICYSVSASERPFFQKLNKYGYDLELLEERLDENNWIKAEGKDAVVVRTGSLVNEENLNNFKQLGIKYIFTRTAGYNHIDLETAKKNEQVVAYVPAYSPYSVAELAFTLSICLTRNIMRAVSNTSKKDFRVLDEYMAREFSNKTIGIYGVGKIGQIEAKLWKGTGAKVLGYDLYPNEKAKEFVEFVSLEEMLTKSDVVSLHIPYFPGKNEKSFNSKDIEKMNKWAVLVNTARAEVVDNEAVIEAIKEKKLFGFATDVIENETRYFGKNYSGNPIEWVKSDKIIRDMVDLYPQVLITPHLGATTCEAEYDMVETSFENIKNAIEGNMETGNFLVHP
jgi:D-lactate dehydrogenase